MGRFKISHRKSETPQPVSEVPPGARFVLPKKPEQAGPGTGTYSEISAIMEKQRQLEAQRLEEDVKKSKEQREDWLRDSWRIARETLDVAREALIRQDKRARNDFSAEEVRATVNVLQNEAMWNDLLRIHNLADNDAAKAAAHELIVCIKGMETAQVSPDALPRLIDQIDSLRKQLAIVSRHPSASLPHGVVHDFLKATSKVSSEVTVGLIAVSTAAEVGGAQIVPEVVYTAVGLAVAATVKQLYKRVARKLRNRTIPAQLKRYHPELVASVGQLARFLPWLALDPPPEGALETVQSAHVAAIFLVTHVEQLANAFAWPDRLSYLKALHFTGEQLNGIRNIAAGQRGGISQPQPDLPEACKQLHEFDDCIRRLRK